MGATTHVVRIEIVVEHPKEGHVFKIQRPVYFVSEILSESKVRPIQKLLYAILIMPGKLHHYFDEYCIAVITDSRWVIFSIIATL